MLPEINKSEENLLNIQENVMETGQDKQESKIQSTLQTMNKEFHNNIRILKKITSDTGKNVEKAISQGFDKIDKKKKYQDQFKKEGLYKEYLSDNKDIGSKLDSIDEHLKEIRKEDKKGGKGNNIFGNMIRGATSNPAFLLGMLGLGAGSVFLNSKIKQPIKDFKENLNKGIDFLDNTPFSKQINEMFFPDSKQAKMKKLSDQEKMGYNIIEAFKKAGMNEKSAISMGAEVFRETSFDPKNIFGSHLDPENKSKNIGLISFQKDRRKALLKYLDERNLLNKNGTIKEGQESIQAQADFIVDELKSPKYKKSYEAINRKNISKEEFHKIIGKDYINWRMDDPVYSKDGLNNIKSGYKILDSISDKLSEKSEKLNQNKEKLNKAVEKSELEKSHASTGNSVEPPIINVEPTPVVTQSVPIIKKEIKPYIEDEQFHRLANASTGSYSSFTV